MIDPNVWSGRALQEDFNELAVSGLASMYPAFGWRRCSRPSWISSHLAIDRRRSWSSASSIRAVDQETANAGGAHFGEGDFLPPCGEHARLKRGLRPQANGSIGYAAPRTPKNKRPQRGGELRPLGFLCSRGGGSPQTQTNNIMNCRLPQDTHSGVKDERESRTKGLAETNGLIEHHTEARQNETEHEQP